MKPKTLTGVKYKKFNDLSDWMIVDGYFLVRYIKSGNINNILDRVAGIEKTPRVRARNILLENTNGDCTTVGNNQYWIYDYKGDVYSKEFGADEKSIKWCDDMLTLLGYE